MDMPQWRMNGYLAPHREAAVGEEVVAALVMAGDRPQNPMLMAL